MESAIAKLNKYRMSPRKVRLVADMIRGMEVVKAINLLKNDAKKASKPMAKLLLSSVANWHQKNGADFDGELYVDKVMVDSGAMLKRIKPAPQGRAHRIRKRFSSIIIQVNSLGDDTTTPKTKKLENFKKETKNKVVAQKSKPEKTIEAKSAKTEKELTISKKTETNDLGTNVSTKIEENKNSSTKVEGNEKPSTKIEDNEKPSTKGEGNEKPSTKVEDNENSSTKVEGNENLSTKGEDNENGSTKVEGNENASTKVEDNKDNEKK